MTQTEPRRWKGRAATEVQAEYLSIRDVARVLSVTVPTVRSWIKRESLPTIKLGPKVIRVERAALAEWIMAQQKAQQHSSTVTDLRREE